MAKQRNRRRTIGDAKAHFAECIRDAEAGRPTVLTRHGRPVARLEPIADPRRKEAERRAVEEVADPVAPIAATPPPRFRSPAARRAALRRQLVEQIWPRIPPELLGRGITKEEQEEILGYASSTGATSNEDA